MPYDGSGTFSPAIVFVPNTPATAEDQNVQDKDIADGLTDCMTRDGQAPATANLSMGGFQLKNVANGTASTDAVNVSQLSANAGVITDSPIFGTGLSGNHIHIDQTAEIAAIIADGGLNSKVQITVNSPLLGNGTTSNHLRINESLLAPALVATGGLDGSVKVAADGTSITGDGTYANPLVSHAGGGGGGGVQAWWYNNTAQGIQSSRFASITNQGLSGSVFTFSTPQPDTAYAVIIQPSVTAGSVVYGTLVSAQSTNGFTIISQAASGSTQIYLSVIVVR